MSRLESRKVTGVQQDRMKLVLGSAKQLEKCINDVCHDGREKSLAMTKLEECVMWANKSISFENG